MFIRGCANSSMLKVGCFQDNAGCGVSNGCRLSTHDASQGRDALPIGYHKVLLIQTVILAIQSHKTFSRIGRTDNNGGKSVFWFCRLKFIIIESVQGISGLKHDVICDIHDVVDWP